MGIVGLTNDEQGQALQRLPVVIKVAIGLGPDASKGRKAPQKLDHFIFQSRSTTAESGWDPDAEITKKMADLYGTNGDGAKLREFEIVFLDDDIENVFRTAYAWWTQSACQCRGEMVQIEANPPKFSMRAIRRTERAPDGEEWPSNYKYSSGDKKGKPVEPCGDTCPDLNDGRCKASGDLYFIPYKMPVLGATWKIHTTSINSIRNISAALQQIRTMTGGRLAGIPLRLRVDPQAMRYSDDQNKAHKSTAHILSIVFRSEDLQRLISGANEHAKLFQQSRMLLGAARVVVEDDPEPTQARVMPEFYEAGEVQADEPQLVTNGNTAPDVSESQRVEPSASAFEAEPAEPRRTNGKKPGPMAPELAVSPEEGLLRGEITKLCGQLNINRAGEMSLLGQFKGRLAELRDKLTNDLKAKAPQAATPAKTAPPPAQPQGKSASFEF